MPGGKVHRYVAPGVFTGAMAHGDVPEEDAVEAVLLGARPGWMADGACRNVDPDLFFPERGASTVMPKGVCRFLCPVRQQCLDFALDNGEKFGVWGGYSERERRVMRRDRNRNRARIEAEAS